MKSLHIYPLQPHSNRVTRLLALFLSVAVAAVMLSIGAAPAQAKELGNVFERWSERNGGQEAISITTDTGDINRWDNAEVIANWDTTGMNPSAGDTFELTLPPEFSIGGDTFPLTTPDGNTVIGECAVTIASGSDPAVVTCTLTGDYWESHTNVAGSIKLDVQARSTTDESTVEFGVGEDTVEVELPGGPIGPPRVGPKPETVLKNGWFNSDRGELTWRIYVPGSEIDGSGIEIVDTLPEGLDYQGAEIAYVPNTQEGWADYTNGNPTGWLTEGSDYTADLSNQTLTVSIPNPDTSLLYALEIHTTVQPGLTVQPGEEFTNTATVNGQEVQSTASYRTSGSGQGQGFVNGFSVTKEVTGSGADLVGDAEFSVRYSYTDTNGEVKSDTLKFTQGQKVGYAPIPSGTEVTIEEIDLPQIEGITWGTPEFSGDGVTDNGDGTATFTIVENSEVAITLTNTANSAPTPTPSDTPSPSETPSDTPAPSETPSETPSPTEEPSSTPSSSPSESAAPSPSNSPAPNTDDDSDNGPGLPKTGAAGTAVLAGIGALLFALGGLALWMSRRNRTQV